jgi:peroxiredoxin
LRASTERQRERKQKQFLAAHGAIITASCPQKAVEYASRAMARKKRVTILAILFAAGAIAAAITYLLPPPVNRPAPDVDFELLDGRSLALAELRGKAVLVAFWATSCGPCVEEIPDLVALYEEFAQSGLELIAVAMPYDPPIQVAAFSREHRLPFPVAPDVTGNVTQAFGGIDFIPVAFLIDATGRIVYHRTGKLRVNRARRLINGLLPTTAGFQRAPRGRWSRGRMGGHIETCFG